MIKLALVLLLVGEISNEYGRTGIMINSGGRIGKVFNHSPAHDAGLLRGDVVLEADGHKGIKYIDGIANTTATLKVKRGGEVIVFNVFRVPKREVYD